MLRTMSKDKNQKLTKTQISTSILRTFWILALLIGTIVLINAGNINAQGPVNGSFIGRVTEVTTKAPIANATVTFKNKDRGFQTAAKTDANGNFSRTALPPGDYEISVIADGYDPQTKTQSLYATRSNEVVPVPFELAKAGAGQTTPNNQNSPIGSQTVKATTDEDTKVTLNPRRDGAFDTFSLMNLPLGGSTLTRTFDELALLIPGVNPAPQAIGNTVGPGVGGGVGTSGQFSVNGLRSRANNFMVDGSDNNDEDIGVRRQGFFTLVPQPIESIQEFQIITLLAPAQFGRNLGAQVNALSRAGTNRFRGSAFGLFNSDKLNAPDFFDFKGGNFSTALTGRRIEPNAMGQIEVPVRINGTPVMVTNSSGGQDESTLFQGGLAIGGPIYRNKLFFFASGEGQFLKAEKETHFAVPTVEQRGLFNTGAQGLFINGNEGRVFPTTVGGDATFSFFPFPNDPTGVYGRNTLTQTLPADARGLILSGRVDYNFKWFNDKQQSFTARYNFTDDWRDIPSVGGALFSSIRPKTRTDNISTYLMGEVANNVSNVFRFSFGRTNLNFEEIGDTTGYLLPVRRSFTNPLDARFLMNAPLLFNVTIPRNNFADYTTAGETETRNLQFSPNSMDGSYPFGPIGQLIIAGFSPVGVDVFNFPQERTNKTFQFADTVNWQFGRGHDLAFGTDIRITSLNSNLPRNARPLVTYFGGADFFTGALINPLDLAAAGGPTGFFQSLVLPGNDASIRLSYNQLNFFIQDNWKARQDLTVNFGLRYEFNTTPKEADRKIESSFGQTLPAEVIGLRDFINGRTKIFDSDNNNFAPRIGIAFAPNNKTVIRGGYGLYYDQILGAVVSQSRNVFPTFTTLNFGGGLQFNSNANGFIFNPFNPMITFLGANRIIQPNSLNVLNVNQQSLLSAALAIFPSLNGSPFGATIPTRKLDTPFAHQYFVSVERQIFKNNFLSVGYVGTTGRNLLRFTTPNLGSNFIGLASGFEVTQTCLNNPNELCQPYVRGITVDPFSNSNLTRPNAGIGPISQFETTGRSRYDSLQIGLRGRLFNQKFLYQFNYVYGFAKDDVSDVFDLAGSSALPQNSITNAGEYAAANFDIRHRFTYNFVYNFPTLKDQNSVLRFIFGNWQVAGSGKFYTGQPYTVNTIYDINLDGNLTDRLDNTSFIVQSGQRQRPLSLSCAGLATCSTMLATFGEDGSVGRNSFRAGEVLDLDLSFSKRFKTVENQNLEFRVDIFNFINRANFGVPVRFLEFPSFGQATETITPGRRIQFVVRYNF